MKEDILTITNKIMEMSSFDLDDYYYLLYEYGKDFVFRAFKIILQDNKNSETIFYKFFDAFFTIELENTSINQGTYYNLVRKYGKSRICSYFTELLEMNNNSSEIKKKYELIYSHIDLLKDNFSDDLVSEYLKGLTYRLLTPEEEKEAFTTLENCRKNIKIAYLDDDDCILFYDFYKVMASIRNSKQLKSLYKIKNSLSLEDRKIFDEKYTILKNYFKENSLIITDDSQTYSDNYFDEQINEIVTFVETREKVINSNLKLVVAVAKKYNRKYVEMLDLIQEGNTGLMRAVRKFDTSKNTKFSTYAIHWIRQSVTRAIANQYRTIRLPIHLEEKINKIKKATSQLKNMYGYDPSDEEIAEYLNFSVQEVTNIKTNFSNESILSFDTNLRDDEDTTIGDFIADDKADSFELVASRMLREDMKNIINRNLTKKEAFVIKRRFGLDNHNPLTLEATGELLGITRERVRQIESKSIRKLRRPSNAKHFDGFH